MQNNASIPIKFLYLAFNPDQSMGFHHLVTGDEHMPVLRKSDALLIGLCQEGAGVLLLEEKIYSFQKKYVIFFTISEKISKTDTIRPNRHKKGCLMWHFKTFFIFSARDFSVLCWSDMLLSFECSYKSARVGKSCCLRDLLDG